MKKNLERTLNREGMVQGEESREDYTLLSRVLEDTRRFKVFNKYNSLYAIPVVGIVLGISALYTTCRFGKRILEGVKR